jgi:hypothetical protein
MLGGHHTLLWNKFFQHGRGWLFQILLWGMLRGRRCWRTQCLHGVFHLFEIRNLGAMVTIMTILTTKSIREFYMKDVVLIPPLAFFFILPLGVLVTLILVSPSRMVLFGVISS